MLKLTNGFNEMGTVEMVNGKYVVYRNNRQWKQFDNLTFLKNYIRPLGLMVVGK